MSALSELGLSPGATMDDARRAYRKIAMREHPDRGGDAEAFKRATAAWEELKADPGLLERPRPHPGAYRYGHYTGDIPGGEPWADMVDRVVNEMGGSRSTWYVDNGDWLDGRRKADLFDAMFTMANTAFAWPGRERPTRPPEDGVRAEDLQGMSHEEIMRRIHRPRRPRGRRR